jgi:hypothetical protein
LWILSGQIVEVIEKIQNNCEKVLDRLPQKSEASQSRVREAAVSRIW